MAEACKVEPEWAIGGATLRRGPGAQRLDESSLLRDTCLFYIHMYKYGIIYIRIYILSCSQTNNQVLAAFQVPDRSKKRWV